MRILNLLYGISWGEGRDVYIYIAIHHRSNFTPLHLVVSMILQNNVHPVNARAYRRGVLSE